MPSLDSNRTNRKGKTSTKAICLSCILILALRHIFYAPEVDPLEFIGVVDNAKTNEDYVLAKRQSLGFFDDIASSHWKRLQEKVSIMSPNFDASLLNDTEKNDRFDWFWQSHYEPDFVCSHERRIGRQGDGGKWVCDPHRITQSVNDGGRCLVYSIGSSNKFDFEEGVHKDIHKECDIHTFDFGDFAAGAKEAGGKINYHKQGMGNDRTDKSGNVFKSLSTTVQELGHQNRIIDVFKIDCEGCEYATAANWFEAVTKHNITLRQIQVELHKNSARKIMEFFDLMYKHGYVIFHKEPNLRSVATGFCIEYALLKLDAEFVNVAPRTKGVVALAATKKMQ